MKIKRILTLIILITILSSQTIFAIGDVFELGQNFINTGKKNIGTTMDGTSLINGIKEISNIISTIGIIISLFVGIFLGFKYITAGINDKVDVKASLIPYLISCVVVFGASSIWKIVIQIVQQI